MTYDVTGDEVDRLGSADLVDLRDGEILLTGDTVVAIGDSTATTGPTATTAPAQTRVIVLDVSDPAAPEVEHTYLYSAATVEARLHGDTVRLVTQAGPARPRLRGARPAQRARGRAREPRGRPRVRHRGLAADGQHGRRRPGAAGRLRGRRDPERRRQPRHDRGRRLRRRRARRAHGHRPRGRHRAGLLLRRPALSGDAAPARCGGCFEVCIEPRLRSRPRAGCPAQPRRRRRRQPSLRLRPRRARTRRTPPPARSTARSATAGRWTRPAACSGVAVGPTGRTGNFNSIVTFRQDGNDLVEAGRVDKLGVGEDIKSMRWFDGLAIMVTFRQVDPLYAIDLTDPDEPEADGRAQDPRLLGLPAPARSAPAARPRRGTDRRTAAAGAPRPGSSTSPT